MLRLEDYKNELGSPTLWIFPGCVGLLLVLVGQVDYLTFHTLAELAAVFVAYSIFALALETRQFSVNRYLLLLGLGYFWVGTVDLLHTFSFDGMEMFVRGELNLASQLWIAGRYLEALVLLTVPYLVNRKLSSAWFFVASGILAVAVSASILSGHFPDTFVEGEGLTNFKVYSEYVIIAILCCALIQINQTSIQLESHEAVLISMAIVFTICAELSFTLYGSSTDLFNLVGHLFKIFSYWFIYKSMVILNLQRPYAAMTDEHVRLSNLFQDSEVSLWNEDMTEVVEVLEELRQAGVSDLAAHIDQHPDLLTELSAKIRVREVNKKTVELFKAEGQEDFIRRIDRTFTSDTQPVWREELQAIWNGEESFVREASFITITGEPLRCIVAFKIPKRKEDFSSVLVSILDITDQSMTRQNLAGFFETPMHINLIASVDDGTILKVNHAITKALGYAPDEIEGKVFFDMVHPDDLSSTREALESFVVGVKSIRLECRFRHKEDGYRLMSWSGVVIEDIAYGVATDVTSARQAEAARDELLSQQETIAACQSILVRGQNREAVSQALLNELVLLQRYEFAWIAEVADDELLSLLCIAGDQEIQLDDLAAAIRDLKDTPAHRALRHRSTVTQNDAWETSAEEWPRVLQDIGCRASCSLPIASGDEVFGVLTVHSDRDGFPTPFEVGMLQEIAVNVGLFVSAVSRTEESLEAQTKLNKAMLGAVSSLARTVEKRDPYTAGHQDRVAELAVAIAQKLDWDAYRIEGLRLAAILHDIGKISVPAEILNYPGELRETWLELVRSHAEVGFSILEPAEFPWPIAEIVHQHHERLDGSGYPQGLKGDAIMPEARVLAVADVTEAMLSHRPFRNSMEVSVVKANLEAGSGTLFDTEMVNACCSILEEQSIEWIKAS